MENPRNQPRLLVVGGPDVHLRIELLRRLRPSFVVAAAGSETALRPHFAREEIDYHDYLLGRGFNPIADFRSALQLRRLFRQLRPDVVHAYATKPSVWARIAARWAGVPVVVGTVPGLGSLYTSNSRRTRTLRAIYEALQRIACHASHLTIFQNHDDADEFIQAGIAPAARSSVVLGSGIPTDRFDARRVSPATRIVARAEVGGEEDGVVISMTSRLIRTKGVLDFSAAAATLAQRYPKVRFVLVGPNDQASLDRLTPAELGEVRQSVRWLGERRDITALLAASDIFVLPSYYREGVPRVLLEAAAMALPLVAARVPGSTEVVSDGHNGTLVPPRSPQQLSSALEELIGDAEMRRSYGRASRNVAVTKFDLAVVAQHTASAYHSLLGRRRPAPGPAAEAAPRPSAATAS